MTKPSLNPYVFVLLAGLTSCAQMAPQAKLLSQDRAIASDQEIVGDGEGEEFNRLGDFGSDYLSKNQFGKFSVQMVSNPLNLNDDTGRAKNDYVALFSSKDKVGVNAIMVFSDLTQGVKPEQALQRVIYGPGLNGAVSFDFKTVSKKDNVLISVTKGTDLRKFTFRSTDRCNSTSGFSFCLIGLDANLKTVQAGKTLNYVYSVNFMSGVYNAALNVNSKKVKAMTQVREPKVAEFGTYADSEAISDFAKEPSVRDPLSLQTIESLITDSLIK